MQISSNIEIMAGLVAQFRRLMLRRRALAKDYPLHCPALFRCAIASPHHLLHPLPVVPLRVHSFKQASKEQLTPAAIALGVAIGLTPERIRTAEIASKRRCMEILPEMRGCPDNQHRERTKFGGHAKALTDVRKSGSRL
jgi:hypothetical protein